MLEYQVLSHPGRAALHLIEIRGEGCRSWLDSACRRLDPDASSIVYRRLRSREGEVLDDALLIPLGGGDRYLLTVHGNPVIVHALLDDLVSHGARAIPEPVPSRVEEECEAYLPRAETDEALDFLLRQSHEPWGLARRCDQLRRVGASEADLRGLLDRSRQGLAYFHPRTVLLIGPRNAGKSTLFNALVGRTRVIAHAEPGTTRDVIRERIVLRGYPVDLLDGAGLGEPDSAIEREGMARTRAVLERVDLAVEVIPPGATPLDSASMPVPSMRVHSWADTVDPARRGPGTWVSGETGEGVGELEADMLDALVGQPGAGQPVPFTPRQVAILEQALTAVRRGGESRGLLEQL